ncbi:hypothetical protein [Nocardioides jiangxiensis]|uniref:Lipoprotein n=1 Tax=Nocardioides jiangxiensis TaxID=3064524 RepID=A0ABT9B2C9_9ACTN|nr:hypothetical protein [Nocardioides sp. WY-20]MDO7868915.1 hypothetical protein [Nocardioides sp. WY-20]
MKKLATTVLVLALATGATACSSADGAPEETTPTVQTSFPGLPAPSGEPDLAGLREAHPAHGTLAWVAGRFDDRFATHHLRFDGRAASGELDVTSDVSEILELQVLAAFYDAKGAYLGEGRWTEHTVEEEEAPHSGSPDERVRFTVRVPAAYAGKAVAAAAGVTVLVNE